MVTFKALQKMALSFPGATEQPHFDKTSFRAGKIFATYDEKKDRAVVMLSLPEQDVFCLIDKAVIYPVPNKWGDKGATIVEMKLIDKKLLEGLLKSAYETIKI
jgi:predicted DNA-binding protein (MmcQ/YjbR family)